MRRILLHISILIPLVLTLAVIFYNINKGIDFSDEGYYLVVAQDPFNNALSLSRFKYYTSLLYKMVGGNIAHFRSIGLLILLGLTNLLVLSIIKLWTKIDYQKQSQTQILISFTTINFCALVFYYSWLLTPAYNWLALISCLLIAIGGFSTKLVDYSLVEKKNFKIIFWPVVSISAGLVLLFLAKPSSAVALGIILCLVGLFLFERRELIQLMATTMVCSGILFSIHVFVFESGYSLLVNDYKAAMEYTRHLESGHGIIYLIESGIKDFARIPIYLMTYSWISMVLIAMYFIYKNWVVKLNESFQLKLKVERIVILAIISAFWIQGFYKGLWNGGYIDGMKIGYAGLNFTIIIVLCSIIYKPALFGDFIFKKVERRFMIMILFLITIPLVCSFGSGSLIIKKSSLWFLFYAIGILWMCYYVEREQKLKLMSHFAAFILMLSSVFIIRGAMTVPYRMSDPLKEHTIPVTSIGSPSKILVNAPSASYINGLKNLANTNGWTKQSYLLDMTGETPLASYILNAKPLGRAWLLGGYPGSETATLSVLKKIDKEILQNSWILLAPNGPRRIPISVLRDLKLELHRNFEKAGEVQFVEKGIVHELWKPIG